MLIYTKFPSSNFPKVKILPVCLLDDVAYGIYNNVGHVASSSEYWCDLYANALENVLSDTTPCQETIFSVLGT